MRYIHPVMQVLFITLSVSALGLGMQRFRSAYLGHSVRFNWKRHVLFGRLAVVGLVVGAVVGDVATNLVWKDPSVVEHHGDMGGVVIGLFILGAVMGFVMDKYKQKRKFLPLLHGFVNLSAVLLALNQIRTGIALF